jgi:hypothetical protein
VCISCLRCRFLIQINYSLEKQTTLNQAYGLVESLAELKKIYDVAINGSENDKISAATVLCGATLISGWNIQVGKQFLFHIWNNNPQAFIPTNIPKL